MTINLQVEFELIVELAKQATTDLLTTPTRGKALEACKENLHHALEVGHRKMINRIASNSSILAIIAGDPKLLHRVLAHERLRCAMTRDRQVLGLLVKNLHEPEDVLLFDNAPIPNCKAKRTLNAMIASATGRAPARFVLNAGHR